MIEAMKTYRLVTPNERNRPGQSALSPALRYLDTGKDMLLELPWGSVIEAREKCRYPFEFSKAEQKFLVHVDFIQAHEHMFEKI